ncbi:DsbC family protein [Geobacter sp. AOG2]|uniref:DsbC family protein n=1 Tax=Geobacter sp. AOG2 TaxID=1566347 RepID=UPI001CC48331|nr:DsbC family protein [Geobacter sp. AOG2]GFE61363.1 thiol:disulfide interchange protein [Geobacter sp. AOG2]
MLKVLFFAAAVITLFGSPSFAMDKAGHGTDCTSCHTLSVKEASELLKVTGGTVKSIKPAPIQGMFELLVEKDGRQGLVYIDYAKKRLMQGFVIDLTTLQPVSAHTQEELPQKKQATSLDTKTIPLENAIVMGNPKGDRKLYVFTDPDCPYCRKFHEELKTLAKTAPDVAIYIIPFPLAMHPGAYDKARAILETQSQDVLDKAFAGKEVPKPTQDASKARIDANIKFGNANGISGTPTMVMPDGKIVVGGRDAETLKKMLEEK